MASSNFFNENQGKHTRTLTHKTKGEYLTKNYLFGILACRSEVFLITLPFSGFILTGFEATEKKSRVPLAKYPLKILSVKNASPF